MRSGLARLTTAAIAAVALVAGFSAAAQDPNVLRVDVYGAAQADFGYDFNQTNPDWFDVLRTTKLPSFENEFGEDGRTWASVRQSRLGVKGFIPTAVGQLKTIFEFELFGTGVDAGQTTFRLRHAWGELGAWGAGQSWSPFMDPDVFPNTIEYWGPPGMAFFRNVQIRYMPMQGDNELFVALERPGASADGGVYSDRVELQGVRIRTPLPDLSAHFKHKGDWGHVQIAGIVRQIKWDDVNDDLFNLTGSATGWGLNLSGNFKLFNNVIRASALYGEGIENYMNDAPVDIGIKNNFGDPNKPITGEALPVLGLVAFVDHTWNDHFTSAFGWSYVHIDNTDAESPSAFKDGHYVIANCLYTPVAGVMTGAELQWGKRQNFSDGFSVDDVRVQFSFKYNFSASIIGGK